MTWIRLDDGFADHPKIVRAGPLALVAQIRALCYCARHLTDGKFPTTIATRILADLTPLTAADLCLAKLWHRNGKGYVIHDYLAYNPDRVTVAQLREKKARAGHAGGLAKAVADATARATAHARASAMPPSHPITEEQSSTPLPPVDKSNRQPATVASVLRPLNEADALWNKIRTSGPTVKP